MGIKQLLKKYFLILKVRNRFSAQVQISQRHLFHYYQELVQNNRAPSLRDTGFRVFSQFEEDGKLLFIFSVLGMGNKLFIDIGSDDGVNSNCANLVLNFGWHGVFIDARTASVERGKRFYSLYPHRWGQKPVFKKAFATPESVNDIIASAGLTGEVDLLSIDIDGDDYWIWKAISVVQPRVVIIETHVMFGHNNIVVPYSHPQSKEKKDYHGASPVAMVELARSKGYKLVGTNDLGFNFIFIRQGLADSVLPEISVEEVLTNPALQSGFQKFEAIKDLEYVRP